MDLSQKRVLVTGGGGFLGQHVLRRLRTAGCPEVSVIRRAQWDLTDAAAVAEMYRALRPQLVVHLAGTVGGISFNRARPAETLYDNLMMGLLVVELGRRAGVEKLVAISSVCAYPKDAPIPFREEDLWNGYPEESNGPYGVAKRVLTLQAQVYQQQYAFDAVSLVLTNLYGPGDDFSPDRSHVIPALIHRYLQAAERGQETVEAWGTGDATREFLYVEDAAEAIVLACQRYDDPQPVNVASGQETSIRELTELIARLTGFTGRTVWDASKPEGQPRRSSTTDRAERALGFTSRTSLEDGLRATIAWRRAQGNYRYLRRPE